MEEDLITLCNACTKVEITPRYKIGEGTMSIRARVCVQAKDGTFQSSELFVEDREMEDALKRAARFASEFRASVNSL